MDRENRHLRFVLRYYAPGRFDTKSALRAYRADHPAGFRLLNRFTIGIAASVAVCIALGYHVFNSGREAMTRLYAYDNTVSYTLPDSSVVTLFPHSSLSYHSDSFGDDSRQVEMTGKVEFRVTKNPEAPFVANATYATVTVLGTQFTVDELNPDSIGVSVTSGKVRFTAKDGNEGIILTKGMHACLLAGADAPEIIETTQTGGTPATHKFVFDNTPLPDVLKRLSAHFNVSLTCSSTGKVLTAEFETDNLDEIIMLIEKSLDVKIEKETK